MTKAARLKVVASSKWFLTCKCCDYTYMPMTKWTETNCPKCNPLPTKAIDPDVEYLEREFEERMAV